MPAVSALKSPGLPGEVESLGVPSAFPKKIEVGVRRVPDPISVIGEFDPRRVSDQQLDLMRVDPDLSLGLSFVQSMIVNASWSIQCDDRRQREFMTRAYDRVHSQLMRRALGSMWFGRQPVVVDYERVDAFAWTYHDEETGSERHAWPYSQVKALVPKQIRSIPPLGAEPVYSETDDDTYLGFRHPSFNQKGNYKDPKGNGFFVPADLGIWFTHGLDQSYESMYGRARTLAAFRPWWAYWFAFLMADRHFENDADPPLVVSYPAGVSIDPDNPQGTVDNQLLAERIGTFLKEGGTISMPSDTYTNEEGKPTGIKKWDAKFLEGGSNMPEYQARLEQLRKLKLAAVLLPPSTFDPEVSTNNTSAGDMFLETQVLAVSEIDDTINEHFLPKIAAANFANPAPCKKITTGIRDRDKQLYEDILKIVIATLGEELGIDFRAMAAHVGMPLTTPKVKLTPPELGGPQVDAEGNPIEPVGPDGKAIAPGTTDKGGKAAGGLGKPPAKRAAVTAPTGRVRRTEGPGSRGPDTGRSGQQKA